MKKVIHLKTGWNDSEFEKKVQKEIRKWKEAGYEYVDIKISSKDNHCLLIFEGGGAG